MTQLLASRYEVGPLLGAGGMARVVRGRDTRLDRPVAIKLVPADAIDPVGRERFGREARSSAGFDHPNAVTAFDAGESDGYLFLVMELVDGASLADLLVGRGPLPFDEAVRIEDAVLAALGAAHAAGIVHRDVKPSNVLLDRHGRVKLADFGIARRLDDLTSDLTGVGRLIGTPKYLAPEQIAGDPATPASDLYAAGVVLYEMLAGTPPFDAPSPMELAWAHHHSPVPDVRLARPDVPPALVGTIATAMSKDPAARFATADAMRRALTAAPAPSVAPTALLAAPVLPPTVVGPAPRTATTLDVDSGSGSDPVRSRRRWGWVVALGVLLAATITAISFGRGDGQPSPAGSTTPTTLVRQDAVTTPPAPAPAPPPEPVPTDAPEPSPAPTEAPTTQPPATTEPPSTATPTTEAPSTEPPLDDIGDLLGGAPDLYGERTQDLFDELTEVNGDPERARRLLERAAEWAGDGELDPVALPVLEELLGGLAAQAGGDDGGDNDDGGDGDGDGGDGDGGDDGGGEGGEGG